MSYPSMVIAALLYLAAVVGALHAIDVAVSVRRRGEEISPHAADLRHATPDDGEPHEPAPRGATPYRTPASRQRTPPPDPRPAAASAPPTPVEPMSVVTAAIITWLAGSAVVLLFHGCSR